MTAPRTLNHDQLAYVDRLLELVGPKLQLVEEELRRNFQSPIKTIQDVGEHILAGGGKRLRPSLLLIAAQMLKYEGYSDVIYGAVVEFIHNATLVHDDIIDEADVRRGRTSINYRWGNNLTVLVGDYLFMHSMDYALAEGRLDVLRLLSHVTLRMIEGEILGLETNGRADLSVDEYLDIVNRKTALLFGACCRIPGYIAEAPEPLANALQSYGFNLGVCFQLIDDLLDFTSSTEILGKPVLSDLKEGKITLPLILAMPRATPREREIVTHVVTTKSFDGIEPREILDIVHRYGTLEQARGIAQEYAARGRAALEPFAPSAAKELLAMALDYVMDREK